MGLACAGPAPVSDAGSDAIASDAVGPLDAGSCLLAGCRCPSAGTLADVQVGDTIATIRVPASLDCTRLAPWVVEIPGEHDDGETLAMDALAESEGLVLVRSVPDADLEHLAAVLVSELPIDPARLSLVGSGSGARAVARVLREGTLLPEGIALIDYDAPPTEASASVRAFGTVLPRIYLSTGERARGIAAQRLLQSALEGAGFGDGYHLYSRGRDSVESTPGWLFPEAWSWLDLGVWPESGVPNPAWARDPMFPAPDDALLAVDAMPDGTLVAGSAEGQVLGANESDKWAVLATLGPGSLVGVLAGDGAPLLASTAAIVRSSDGIDFARDGALPSVGAVLGIATDGTRSFGVTADALVRSDDHGVSWSVVVPLARASGVAVSPTTGTVVAIGLGGARVRVPRGGAPESQPSSLALHDIAAGADGRFWAVGPAGIVVRSDDDGLTLDPIASEIDEDLYAVHVASDGAVIAGGAQGSVVVSHDGHTFVSWSVATQDYVGAVRWLGPGRALALGEHGLAVIHDGL